MRLAQRLAYSLRPFAATRAGTAVRDAAKVAIAYVGLYANRASANSYFQSDGVHPTGPSDGSPGNNSGGHALWADWIYNSAVVHFQ
ncbi:MAG: hypothetical protein JWL84_5086 [Rhodospirillales bacterium]|jgi:hypothetical protein|nr:hypothetical protein [Rhodospirillales bacterium]